MEEKYVLDNIIFETGVGSRAYGTNNEDSDHDRAGIMIPGKEYFLGLKRVEQYQDFETDRVIYNLRKALKLMMDNNPNMLDLLWAPERCIIKTTEHWDKIQENRDLFLSKKVRYTYSGYAIAQLRRIKTHRKFILDPPEKMPVREDYGLKDVSIFPNANLKAVLYSSLNVLLEEDKHDFLAELDTIYKDIVSPLLARFIKKDERALAMEWIQLNIKAQAKAFLSLGTNFLKEEFVDIAEKEVRYYTARKEWEQYQNWAKHRNKARAVLEENFGHDTKHAMHLVRLLRMGVEALEKGNIYVDRTNIDAEELIEIRNGAWSFEKLEEYANTSDVKLAELYKKSELRDRPDHEEIHQLCTNVISDYLSRN